MNIHRDILSDLLKSKKSIKGISSSYKLEEDEVLKILKEYHVSKNNNGLLLDKYKNDEESIERDIDEVFNKEYKKNIIVHYRVLKLFLVHGYTKRGICRIIDEIKDDSGKKSQKITDMYNIHNEHRGILFLHKKINFENIIREIIIGKEVDESKMQLNTDRFTSKYDGAKIVVEKDNDINLMHNILNGELRNLIQDVFNPLKADIGMCQFKGCNNIRTQSSHCCEKGGSRPEVFTRCVEEYFKETEQCKEIDVKKVLDRFLEMHRNFDGRKIKVPPITYLCDKHHGQYEKYFKDGNMSKKINNLTYKEFVETLIL